MKFLTPKSTIDLCHIKTWEGGLTSECLPVKPGDKLKVTEYTERDGVLVYAHVEWTSDEGRVTHRTSVGRSHYPIDLFEWLPDEDAGSWTATTTYYFKEATA